jgi:hypothetical protein
MNKIFTLLLLTLLLQCCTDNEATQPATSVNIDSSHKYQDTISDDSLMHDEMATYYFVIADTGILYALLRNKMFELSRSFNKEIDTMGRYYNAVKDMIVLPEDDKDEMYAGSYFPRRYPSESLSLEYLDQYYENATPKTIALVTGVFDNADSAARTLSMIRQKENKAFTIKASVYLGCMH